MDQPTSSPAPTQPTSPAQAVLTAWPRSAQLTAAFFLGLATALLAVQIYASSRWACRPLERTGTPVYQIDLNRAERAELLQVPGVGPQLVDRILQSRQERGPFRSVNDLRRVHGIGPSTLERLRDWVCVTFESEEPEPPPVAIRTADLSSRKDPEMGTGGGKAAALTSPIDVNRADLTELQKLPGIGPKMAQRMVDVREKKAFQSVEDLRRVPGIGPKTLERLRPFVIVQRDFLVGREPN